MESEISKIQRSAWPVDMEGSQMNLVVLSEPLKSMRHPGGLLGPFGKIQLFFLPMCFRVKIHFGLILHNDECLHYTTIIYQRQNKDFRVLEKNISHQFLPPAHFLNVMKMRCLALGSRL